jgi:hypothetical protein
LKRFAAKWTPVRRRKRDQNSRRNIGRDAGFMAERGQQEDAMRNILCALGALTIAMTVAPRADAAPIYRYCAQYEDRGDVTCAYDTFQQCLDTARGPAGGTCSENPAWRPPAPKPERKVKRKAG